MKVFSNLNELLDRLHTEKKLLNALFQSRMKFDFSYEEACNLVSSEKNLTLLIDYGILRLDSGFVEMEETYQQFFENILILNENVSSAVIEESLQQLNVNIDYYLQERNSPDIQRKYVGKISRILRNIEGQSENTIIRLKRVVNDTFRQEPNYEIKRRKLQSNGETLRNISTLIRDTERLLIERQDVLDAISPDSRLARLSMEVRVHFKHMFHSIIEVQRIIIDYLNQIDEYDRSIKKIRKIKYLKDQLIWEKATSICSFLSGRGDLLLESKSNYSTRVSLAMLRDRDEGLDIISNIRKTIGDRQRRVKVSEVRLLAEELKPHFKVIDFIDTDAIANAFFASGQDLFSFVMNYRYAVDQTYAQKIEHYSEIVVNHIERLQVTDELKTYGSVMYPLIYIKK